eukprot:2486030-Rhodomonas_salina.3
MNWPQRPRGSGQSRRAGSVRRCGGTWSDAKEPETTVAACHRQSPPYCQSQPPRRLAYHRWGADSRIRLASTAHKC